ncbi:MAG TPA: hypothetical protein VEA41_07870 [Salinarimonas sp.]|nr:hypothetical protein [Salinarimonas sp.]
MTRIVAVTDLHSGETRTMPLTEAADLAEVWAEEIEWALEEYGECTTEGFNIVEPETATQ